MDPDPKTVFVVHGRNQAARRAMFTFLRSIDLEPIEWDQALFFTGKATPYIGEVLDAAFRQAQAILVLFTGDDVARLGTRFQVPSDPPYETILTPQARPNVLFEAGMAFGRQPDRTVLVALSDLRPFSDVAGRHVLRISNSAADRQSLLDRLILAGCAARRTSGTDWLSEGDFEGAANDPDDLLRDWVLSHPAQYSGPVWIRVTARDEYRYQEHAFVIEWGPWRYNGVLDFSASNSVTLLHAKGNDGLSIPILFRLVRGICG